MDDASAAPIEALPAPGERADEVPNHAAEHATAARINEIPAIRPILKKRLRVVIMR